MRTTRIAPLLALLALAGCNVKVNDEGKLPEVDVRETGDGGTQVNVKPGTFPDVDVSTDSLRMPKVEMPDVKMPDVDLPSVRTDTTRRDTARRG
ncbi:MAG TPA: hypothetical protein VEX86_03400 [Longimicrobium sp.]|nr:hypothetical protein [Longimicrobium sp.]